MKNIKKEFIENIENFERNLRNNDRTGLKSKDEIESLNYTDKNNNDYDQTLLADIDIMKASKIVSESSNRYDKQMEIDEIRNFLKYQRNMDPSAYMKMIQKKMPSIETSMRQTHEYLNRIHEKKMKEDETNKEKKYRRRKILLSQQRSRKENEKTALDNFLLNQLLNESKQERRIAEQLMEMRKQKNLIYEDRCKKNQQYAEKREKDYELALIREEELGRKSREEYERKLLLQKQKHDEELLIKEEEKKQETYRIINEIVSELVDLSCKICEYKLTNEGNITKKQIDALKTLIAKGLPLEDKYIFELIKNSEMSEDKKEIADNLIEGLDPQQTSNSILGENYTLTNDNNKNGINNADYNFNNEKKLSLEDESKEKVMENSLDKNNGNKIEENVQGVILMESVPEIPNSLISKMDENENVDLIQVDEANRNVLRGVQILDEEEFMDYLKGQNNWEYTFW
ncbi:hypothetical protein H8356DRAFT_940672 [Neocallimastix lanati (nom. inval.)]|uniref:CPC1/SPEF2 domain-containing protein n=1 Tax=Neocallimastix californiae TaxID=1754190 RepID=A0A1Y2A8U1_9FUNG|nr:hypothetical protein H8356DRAFT_940672 [Neocallimastix sp. JGI-2020a]ORY18455.1 hypothetical protein LY90DRAFT_517428 [Neocallimastix californiae]|eukprot:ORY18455.1 hypothetical protein LY90DRAFT_517428 [Neocallimastix californiae]